MESPGNFAKLINLKPSLVKTLFFNLAYLPPEQAVKLPVLISPNVLFACAKGKVRLTGQVRPGMIKIGFEKTPIFDIRRSRTIWNVSGEVIFRGSASIGHGSRISVDPLGILQFGDQFLITAESTIVC